MSRPDIRPVRAEEVDDISALALRSKGYWGYSKEFLDDCRDELTYTVDDIESGEFFVAASDDLVSGFYLVRPDPPRGELSSLFVDPPAIGSGLGGRLLRHALARSHRLGIDTLVLDADPDAEPFYLRYGARRIGQAPSGSIPGRVLPQLEISTVDDGLTRSGRL